MQICFQLENKKQKTLPLGQLFYLPDKVGKLKTNLPKLLTEASPWTTKFPS